jgi:succinoglycan biosynthesis transport protein ExoP
MTPHAGRDSEVSLRDYLRLLRKHQWLVTGVLLVTVITTLIWTSLQVPIFQASATVLIEPEAPKILNIPEVTQMGGPDRDYYLTQYEIIKSRPVLERTMETLRPRLPDIGRFLGAVRIEPKANTRLVFVKFEHPDPRVAAQVANAVADTYTKYNLDLKLKGAREALSWLGEQMNELKEKVRESSISLQNYRVKAGIMGLEEQRKITAQKIMDFNKAYLDAQAHRLAIEAKLRELTQIARDKAGALTIFTVADNLLIQKLKAELTDLEVEKSKLLEVYKEKHPEMLKVNAKIQQVNDRVEAEIQTMIRGVQTEYKVARAREETLLGNVNQLRREGQEFSEKEIQYLTLQRENDSNQQLYEAVLKRLKETGVTGGLETNNVRVIEEARAPTAPVKPNKLVNFALSVVFGLVLGAALAFAIEYFDRTVKSPEEVERYFGRPVIGIVPTFTVKR